MTIHNLDTQPFDELHRLCHSYIKFHLFGSRYFGYAKIDSDYDLVTEDNTVTNEYLKMRGYKRKGMNPSWLDEQTVYIYDCPFAPSVHVVTVKDIVLKLQAMTYIKVHPDLLNRLKVTKDDDRKLIWNHVYHLLLGQNDELQTSDSTGFQG